MSDGESTAGKAGGTLIGVAVGAAVFFGLRALEPETRMMVYGGIFAGTLAGLLPYFVAKSRGRKALGGACLLACLLAGAALGLLAALPLAVVLTVALFVLPKGAPAETSSTP